MRKLQIILREFNTCYSWGLCGLQILVIGMATFGICGVVWAEGPLKIHLAITNVGIILIISLIIGNLANIFVVSEEVLAGWRRCLSQHALLKRVLQSTPPIRVFIGRYFYADKMLVLTCLGIIVENSVTLLVSRRD